MTCEVWLNYGKVRLYVTTPQRGGKGGGNTHTYVGTYSHKIYIGRIRIPMGIDTTHLIGLGFSQRIIHWRSDGKSNPLILITLFTPTIVFYF